MKKRDIFKTAQQPDKTFAGPRSLLPGSGIYTAPGEGLHGPFNRQPVQG